MKQQLSKIQELAGDYRPRIKRKHNNPRQAIRRLIRSFEPLRPPPETPGKGPENRQD